MGICRNAQPFEIRPQHLDSSMESQPEWLPLAMETDATPSPESLGDVGTSVDVPRESSVDEPQPSTSSGIASGSSHPPLPDYSAAKTGLLHFYSFSERKFPVEICP